MGAFAELKEQFIDPAAEYSPVPFWFWNDGLSREELIRQIHEFHAKEVDGFVIHPRMGLPRSIPYLSDEYMELVEAAVAEAASLGMRVILYDEGMYPSGSACGMVVQENPDYASRGLMLREIPCQGADTSGRIEFELRPGEKLVSVQAVRKLSANAAVPGSVILLEHEDGELSFTSLLPAPSDEGDWSVLLFIETLSGGTIRGVHPGQDDGEPDAPAAADLLNPAAVQAFIRLTHERYYQRLSRYFGSTVFAMFTDEPDLLGRGHKKGLKPWTDGFLDKFEAAGGRACELAALWFDLGEDTARIRSLYDSAVRSLMAVSYYKPLADWCADHGIALTGHPAGSDDIGLLEHFQIPGQDVVWRYIAPEEGKALTGPHSTMGKCSSDAARHRGRRRNLNEVFGVCGIDGGWSLSADNMKWYLDWLFVRGVNLISPHAFYYSIRDERRDERPPDVGPNNIWWPEYAMFARYIKRMSWLMTDSSNGAETAVLAGEAFLPWRIVKPLYQQQIEFNYLEESLLENGCVCKDGILEIAGYRYRSILVEQGSRFKPETWAFLKAFAEQGGQVIELCEAGGEAGGESCTVIGQLQISEESKIPAELVRVLGEPYALEPAGKDIRISRVSKEGNLFYVIVNEGEEYYAGELRMGHSGAAEIWRPWTGASSTAVARPGADGMAVRLELDRRECLIVAVKREEEPDFAVEQGSGGNGRHAAERVVVLDAGWKVAAQQRWSGEKRDAGVEFDAMERIMGRDMVWQIAQQQESSVETDTAGSAEEWDASLRIAKQQRSSVETDAAGSAGEWDASLRIVKQQQSDVKTDSAEHAVGRKVVEVQRGSELPALTSWTEWSGMESFSGTVVYEQHIELDEPSRWTEILLDLGTVHEIVRVEVNGWESGVQMWSPYMFDLSSHLQSGSNVLRVAVTNSLANAYDGKQRPSGLIGPVQLKLVR